MLKKYHKLQPKPKATDELKAALQTIIGRAATRTYQQGGSELHKNLTAYMAIAATAITLSIPKSAFSSYHQLFRATNRLLVKTRIGTLRN